MVLIFVYGCQGDKIALLRLFIIYAYNKRIDGNIRFRLGEGILTCQILSIRTPGKCQTRYDKKKDNQT